MNILILTAEKHSELAALNATGEPLRQLCAVPLNDGHAALNADLLTDCAQGQTWENYQTFLESLPTCEVDPTQIVEITMT